jgi:hypothetical protein
MFEEGCAIQLCPWLLPFIFAATAVAADSIAGSWITTGNPHWSAYASSSVTGLI